MNALGIRDKSKTEIFLFFIIIFAVWVVYICIIIDSSKSQDVETVFCNEDGVLCASGTSTVLIEFVLVFGVFISEKRLPPLTRSSHRGISNM